MKFRLVFFAVLIGFCSFQTKTDSTVTIATYLNANLTQYQLNGVVDTIIERRYSVKDDERELTNETVAVYDSAGFLISLTTYRLVNYMAENRKSMERSGQLNYTYDKGKLMSVESYFFRDPAIVPDSSDRSYIIYSYKNDKAASYEAFRYKKLDHTGNIKLTSDNRLIERIQYPDSKNSVERVKTFDYRFNKLLEIETTSRDGEKRIDETKYVYERDLLKQKTGRQLTENFTYELDDENNWVKRTTTLKSGLVVEERQREIIYRKK